MNDKIISGRALNALAYLTSEVRRRTGGTDWHEPGILDALAKATDHIRCTDAGTLVLAATRAASDTKNRTPAVIALDGQHWDERAKPPERKITTGPDATFCPRCRGLIVPGETDHQCRIDRGPAWQAAKAEAFKVAAAAKGSYQREAPRPPHDRECG